MGRADGGSETTARVVGCVRCGSRAVPKDGRWVTLRDAPAGDGRCGCGGQAHLVVPRSRQHCPNLD
jgi:hypothetical protein